MVRRARIISWVGHPLTFVTVTVGVVVTTQLARGRAFLILAALVMSFIAPTALLLFFGVRSGRWRDADVSVREERKRFYPVAIPLSAIGTAIMWWIGAPRYILRGGIVTLSLLTIAAIINLRFKISLHTLFASFCTAVLFRVSAVDGIAASALTALVFWSRLFLSRHTVLEMAGGLVFGITGGIIAAWLPI